MNAPGLGLIGMHATYCGSSNPHLSRCTVRVMAVCKRLNNEGLLQSIEGLDDLATAVEAGMDVVEVLIWLPQYRRLGTIANAVRLGDLRDLRVAP